MGITRRGLLGVAAGATGIGLVRHHLARADEKPLPARLPQYEESLVPTVCQQCPGGCGLLARVIDGEVVGISGNPRHPVNRGTVCAKAFGALQLLRSPDRVRGPMIRDGQRGRFKSATWDEALKLVGERLADLRARRLTHTVAILGGQYRGTRDALWRQFARAYGTPNYLRTRCLAPCPGRGQAECGDYRHAWRCVGEVRVVVKLQGVVRLGRLSSAVAPRGRCLMCQRSSPDRPSRRLRLLSCRPNRSR